MVNRNQRRLTCCSGSLLNKLLTGVLSRALPRLQLRPRSQAEKDIAQASTVSRSKKFGVAPSELATPLLLDTVPKRQSECCGVAGSSDGAAAGTIDEAGLDDLPGQAPSLSDLKFAAQLKIDVAPAASR